jgi:hypothetical protein
MVENKYFKMAFLSFPQVATCPVLTSRKSGLEYNVNEGGGSTALTTKVFFGNV